MALSACTRATCRKPYMKIELGDIPGIGRRMEARLKDAGIVSVEQLMGLKWQANAWTLAQR